MCQASQKKSVWGGVVEWTRTVQDHFLHLLKHLFCHRFVSEWFQTLKHIIELGGLNGWIMLIDQSLGNQNMTFASMMLLEYRALFSVTLCLTIIWLR